LEKEAEKAA